MVKCSRVCTDLCAAAVAAASVANCLIALSSKYFCSQRVISASNPRILSSLSLSRSSSAGVLDSHTLRETPIPARYTKGEPVVMSISGCIIAFHHIGPLLLKTPLRGKYVVSLN